MVPGTPGFHGIRLREAREARGLTALQLAELLGVSKQTVSMYEKARCSPSPDIFDRLVQILRVQPKYFLRPPKPQISGPIFYRSMAAATQRMRLRAKRKMGWVREILHYVSRYVDLPAINLPDLTPPADPVKIDEGMVESAATHLRQHWGLGDSIIGNVTLLMENAGVVASRFEIEATKLDAFSLWDEILGRPLVIFAADKDCAARSRFDAAHELGHLLLHRNVPEALLRDKRTFALIEEQADRFGRAFLLPSRTFCRDFTLPTLNALRNLKPKQKLSIGLMIMRAEELGLISPQQANRLWINRSRQGWARREPYDDEIEPEQPVLLRRSIELLIESGTIGSDDLLDGAPISPEDIEALTGLPNGYLRPRPGPTPESPSPEPRLLEFPRRSTG